ncbi:ATPase [Limibaculum sp. M0105]|uniref:ATPase n=1 Tax=Thermohalobaculum xanthum TaxID=2753746 RepID=A0A8J7M6U1_9RHOB|nr:ATPase [Thermohalobaculum xanthum]MBK0398917.1 ATPase [Thermohalobaculum xanthum]
MIYRTAEEYLGAPQKAVALFGMSGLGKTRIAAMLRAEADWFHYSIDFRIGTRYMGEHIVDNFKREAMRNPFLRQLLRSDSIYIASNISFQNLAPLSTYLGKPGNPEKGGIPFEEYVKRQRQHREAEIAALQDTQRFIEKARDIYGYAHFMCDTGGSICEVVDPEDPADPVLTALSDCVLLVQIRGTDALESELVRRFEKAPKPMYYPEDFLRASWARYLDEMGVEECAVDPDHFIAWGFRRLLAHRVPRYAAIARNWGVSVEAAEIAAVQTPDDFDRLIATALERQD